MTVWLGRPVTVVVGVVFGGVPVDDGSLSFWSGAAIGVVDIEESTDASVGVLDVFENDDDADDEDGQSTVDDRADDERDDTGQRRLGKSFFFDKNPCRNWDSDITVGSFVATGEDEIDPVLAATVADVILFKSSVGTFGVPKYVVDTAVILMISE